MRTNDQLFGRKLIMESPITQLYEPCSGLLFRCLLLALLFVGQQSVQLVPHEEDAALGPPRIDNPAPLFQILESVVEQEHVKRSRRNGTALAERALLLFRG